MRYLLIIMLIVCNVSFAQVSLHNAAIHSGVRIAKTISDFVFDAETQTITAYIGTNTDVVIPSAINGVNVLVIGDSAFKSKSLTSVVIPSGITTIGQEAFSSNALTSLVLPNTVTSLGVAAFSGNLITSVTFSTALTSLPSMVFYNNKFTTLNIPGYIATIGNNAFERNLISTLTLTQGVTSIGALAFSDNRIVNIIIPRSVSTMGSYAFYRNKASVIAFLTPAKITTIPTGAFDSVSYYGGSVTGVAVPASVTTISEFAFYNLPITQIHMESASTSIYNVGNYFDHRTMGVYGTNFVSAYTGGGIGAYQYTAGNWVKL